MVQNLLSLSANSAALSLNGSAGVIHISVSPVIKSNVVEIMCPGKQKINCRNVLGKNVLLKLNIRPMGKSMR
jgi:hypothetical protein